MRQTLSKFARSFKVAARKKVATTLAPFLRPIWGGKGCIVMLHRVLPAPTTPRQRFGPEQHYEDSVEHVEKIVHWFFRNGYDPINIDQVEERIKQKNGRRFVVFTVDDGYIDGYQHIRPLFKRLNIPWTFYISTAHINRTVLLDAHLLERRILAGDIPITLELPDSSVSTCYCNSSRECDEFISKVVSFSKQMEWEKYRDWCWEQLGRQNLEDLADQLCCNWDQVREMAHDPNIIIGAHSVTHSPLALVSAPQLGIEVRDSRKIIESKIDMPVDHFAYPYGSVSMRVIEEVKKAGYSTAVTTTCCNLFEQNARHIHALPRISWGANDETTFNTAVSGADSFILFRGQRFTTRGIPD
ncbi:MAG: polysaccharide deacetylase family protein [Deltaproteobacteria bacterium]|nr:polysaccharide deacetylase family protein [Deltaproteobacteria bacterium]